MNAGCKTLFCVIASLAVTVTANAARIIAEGDTWQFHNGFTFPGSNWTATNYDDTVTGWFSFPSGFGYGDGDDATNLADMQNGYAAFFTRKKFVVTNPAAVNYLTLGVDYDDGFVAFINGTEVARGNVVGTVTNTLFSAGNHEASRGGGVDNPNEKEFFTVNPNVLVPGTNVIAVSCHNVSLGSSDASLIVEVYTNITLVRGPFIQMPDTNKVTVVWRTDALTDCAVDFGFDTGYGGGTVSDPALTREHVVNIPNLLLGTNYFYRVRSGGATLWQGDAFRTKRAGSQPFRMVIIGDFGAGTPSMGNIATQVNAVTDADLLLTVGDNIYPDGQPGLFDPYWFSIYAPTMRRMPTFPALGNHDVAQGAYSGQAYINNFYLPTNGPAGQIERNYSYDYGNAHFAAVDANPFTNAAMNSATITAITTWLSNDLALASKPWKLVYFHHPPYTSTSTGHSPTEAVSTNLVNILMPIIEGGGVQVVFDGHQHWYERMNAINGVYHITTGAGGQSLYAPTSFASYSAVVNSSIHSFSIVDIDGTRLKLRQIDENGAQIDQFNLDIGHPFKIDGLLDNSAWLRADNGLKLYAAIRGPYLYVASQDAGEGGDNFIYMNNVLSTNRAANWAKAGQVTQWNAFVADENDNAFQGWFGSTETLHTEFPYFQSMTSGLNNNGALGNGVLEGTIDLTNRFGTFPQQLYLAAAAFASADGGALSAQAPAGNGDGNIQANEFLALNARDIALDLPVANAGPSASVLVNTPMMLNGAGSSAPSGGALSFSWTQLTGPAGPFTGAATVAPSYTPGSFTGASSNALFRLVVNDGRFDSDPSSVTVIVKNDSDGDGLTDNEESTGVDDPLTLSNPNGAMTNPNLADTDGDGASDGEEALAGTNPNSSASHFRVTDTTLGGGGFTVVWSTVSGKTYQVQYRDDLSNNWTALTNVVATSTGVTNVVDVAASGLPKRFYQVVLVP